MGLGLSEWRGPSAGNAPAQGPSPFHSQSPLRPQPGRCPQDLLCEVRNRFPSLCLRGLGRESAQLPSPGAVGSRSSSRKLAGERDAPRGGGSVGPRSPGRARGFLRRDWPSEARVASPPPRPPADQHVVPAFAAVWTDPGATSVSPSARGVLGPGLAAPLRVPGPPGGAARGGFARGSLRSRGHTWSGCGGLSGWNRLRVRAKGRWKAAEVDGRGAGGGGRKEINSGLGRGSGARERWAAELSLLSNPRLLSSL